jgi:hypothetical protein
MLVRSYQLAGAVRCVVVRVVWLNEAAVGELVPAARIEEVGKRPEERRLVLEQIDDFERGTCFIEVIQSCGMTRGNYALIDALVLLIPVKDVHAHLAERGSIVSAGAVA